MKKASIIFMVWMLVMTLCSCSCEPIETRNYNSMYNITEIKSNNWVYVDTETNVMYWYSGHGYGGGLSPMLNADGTPKIYDAETSKYNVTEIKSNNWVYVDTETNVMYWYSGHGYGGGLSLMLNADGTPKIYDAETSKYNVTEIKSNNWVYVDTETNVMYWYSGHGYGGGLSLMLNADGTPKIYDAETSKYNVTEIKSNNWVYVDTETDVMYWYSGHGYGGGLDVMIDEVGNPKIAN